MRQFVTVRVRAQEPVQIHLRPPRKGQHGVRVAFARGAVTPFRILAAVPADLRFHHPERLILDAAHEIIPERRIGERGSGFVVVILRDIQLFVDLIIAHAVVLHHVGADIAAPEFV